jgi:hypothetical protein
MKGFRMRVINVCSFSLVMMCFSLATGEQIEAQETKLSVQNAGFEAAGTMSGWVVERAPGAEVGIYGIDRNTRHSGTQSFVVRLTKPSSFAMASSAVELEVGKIYRLSGWIRTENASADPLSRYPTAVAAAFGMTSFPFTNTSMPVGGTRDWTKSEVVFVATQKNDRVTVHFGCNGTATGAAWFDDIQLEEVTDVTEYIPMETVRWYGPAFRYTDKGWTFIHIEGEPYQRGYQYGYLLAHEIAAYLEKLAVRADPDDPRLGWDGMRTLADALLLRSFDEEFLVEMRGIADGAAKGGATFSGKAVDFLDIVTVNSSVDLGQLGGALAKTASPLSGRSFRQDEEEAAASERLHKCTSFLANGPASKDGRIVFAQLFMWNGYTGVHWDVICDVIPTKGHRLVYETFPGGIHSAADFYVNSDGIMIGETTVMQTPFNVSGSPQSSRIRKAAQYASSIDDVVNILTKDNNGLYTNDWLIGDAKTDETAILLLGTKKHKLWRSSSGDFPGGTRGFLWSVNNAKDPEVRKEYVPDPSNAPVDVVFGPVNRDIVFYEYYQREKGRIDAISAANIIATSPLNRPHACDGKVITSEMAEKMVFLAHFGKVTLREKFPEKGGRLIPDLVNAMPHLTLGYSAFSPVYVTKLLQDLHARTSVIDQPAKGVLDLASAKSIYTIDRSSLWSNTVYPASDRDNWFVSGTAAYWQMLNGLPKDLLAANAFLRDQLAELNYRLQYTVNHEGALAPSKTERRYDGYKTYVVPRIRGTILLHQLRLKIGNELFLKLMGDIHRQFREKPLATTQFVKRAGEIAGVDLGAFISQWLGREDIPEPSVRASASRVGEDWRVAMEVLQPGTPYEFCTTVALETEKGTQLEMVSVVSSPQNFTFTTHGRPTRLVFNVGNDIPVHRGEYFTYSNLFDDFKNVVIVYGTTREVEANHTLALRYQTVVADQFTEDLLPVRQDNTLSDRERAASDLVILGNGGDNEVLRSVAERIGLTVGKDMFRWQGKMYVNPNDGLFVAAANPYNPSRAVYCFIANSALQLYWMTRRHQPLPAWALFKGEQVTERGYLPPTQLVVNLTGD